MEPHHIAQGGGLEFTVLLPQPHKCYNCRSRQSRVSFWSCLGMLTKLLRYYISNFTWKEKMASFFPSVLSRPNCQLNTDGTLKLQVLIKLYSQAEVQMHLSQWHVPLQFLLCPFKPNKRKTRQFQKIMRSAVPTHGKRCTQHPSQNENQVHFLPACALPSALWAARPFDQEKTSALSRHSGMVGSIFAISNLFLTLLKITMCKLKQYSVWGPDLFIC